MNKYDGYRLNLSQKYVYASIYTVSVHRFCVEVLSIPNDHQSELGMLDA